MSNWQYRKLGELAKTFSGGTPSRGVSEFYGGEIPWVKSTEVNQSKINRTSEFITDIGLKSSNCKLVPKGAVLIAMYGATAGQVSQLKIEAATNQAVLAIVCDEEVLLPEFVYYVLLQKKSELLYLAQGSGQPNLSKSLIDNTLIPLLPIKQQSRIIEIFSSLDLLIGATQALIDKYTAIKQGMMADLFSRGIDPETKALRPTFEEVPELYHKTPLGMLPKGWGISLLEEVAPVIDPQPDHRTPPQVKEGIPYVGVGDFTWDERIDAKKCRKVSRNAYLKQQSRFKVEMGDVIFGKIGTIGQPKVIREDGEFALSANVLLIKSGMKGNYIRDVLISQYTLAQLDKIVNVTSQPAVGIQTMRELMIPMPDAIELELINSKLQSLESYIWSEVSSLNKLKAQKAGLMQDLLTGKVPVPA
ncbi:restriction endonuclease subunit S [Vibrio sp. VPAP30]|uniref:restriction endonuclease subunit S n=1 Tax=Vibrio sp. VPAP30 TaxID=1647102 RepID=UPI00067667FA|nr:restriction endonuclease subunit S [Vibrio sp. VPAP30]